MSPATAADLCPSPFSDEPHLSNDVTLENVYKVLRYQTPACPHLYPYESMAVAAENLIRIILEEVPSCADRSAAIRKVREALMTASAAVSLETAMKWGGRPEG